MVKQKNRKAELSMVIEGKIPPIKLLLSDCDGVLTDGRVYYSSNGEELKAFSMKDGMGVERLRTIVGVETGIVTGEISPIVLKRVEKLKIREYHPGAKDKIKVLKEILTNWQLKPEQVAYIGDDVNDIEILKVVGLSAAPKDAMPEVLEIVDIELKTNGGQGAFREFAEIIINYKLGNF